MKTSTIEPNVAMLPDSYILTYLEINGVSVHQLQRSLTPQDDDILLIALNMLIQATRDRKNFLCRCRGSARWRISRKGID
jgi:hypothetical protein